MSSRRVRLLLFPAFVAAGGLGIVALTANGASNRSVDEKSLNAILTSSSSTFAVSTNGVPVLYPGATPSPVALNFTNYMNQAISINSLTVTFTNSFVNAGGQACDPTALSFGGAPVSATSLAATVSSTSATTGLVSVPAGSGSVPGMATYSPTLALADNHKSQDACQGLKLAMTYTATATYKYANCITGSQSKATVGAGQVVCVSSSGKVTGGITVQSRGVLYVNGGTVSGGITASSPAGINLCSENVTGGVSVSGSTGPVVIGDGTASCPGGSISGGLTLTGNAAGIQVIGNNITAGFTATFNSGSIPTGTPSSPGPSGQYVESNSGSGGMSCSNNSPALLDGGFGTANTINGSRSTQCPVGF